MSSSSSKVLSAFSQFKRHASNIIDKAAAAINPPIHTHGCAYKGWCLRLDARPLDHLAFQGLGERGVGFRKVNVETLENYVNFNEPVGLVHSSSQSVQETQQFIRDQSHKGNLVIYNSQFLPIQTHQGFHFYSMNRLLHANHIISPRSYENEIAATGNFTPDKLVAIVAQDQVQRFLDGHRVENVLAQNRSIDHPVPPHIELGHMARTLTNLNHAIAHQLQVEKHALPEVSHIPKGQKR